MAIADAQTGSAFTNGRRYDLDWLRVIAFGLLIFYHIGMFYVTWDWHVKSAYAGPDAEPLMILINPWRLALLFFISGVAIRFATDKISNRLAFVRSRLWRLGLPILGGMIIFVAPQSYFELRESGAIEPGYLTFWGNYLKLEQLYPMMTPTWNHLWYVVYLLVYILLIAPFLPMMRRFAEGAGGRMLERTTGGPIRLLVTVTLPFIIYGATLTPYFPETHDLVNDWANHANRLTIFLLGYFAAKNSRFWQSVERALPIAVALVLLIGGMRLYIRTFHWDFYTALYDDVPVMPVILVLYAWSFIVMLLGLAQRYLNRPSQMLTYFTSAVFCYYILHQTIIVIAGYYLTQLRLGVAAEATLVSAITVAGCVGGYEIAKRIAFLRPWLGIKSDARSATVNTIKSETAEA